MRKEAFNLSAAQPFWERFFFLGGGGVDAYKGIQTRKKQHFWMKQNYHFVFEKRLQRSKVYMQFKHLLVTKLVFDTLTKKLLFWTRSLSRGKSIH